MRWTHNLVVYTLLFVGLGFLAGCNGSDHHGSGDPKSKIQYGDHRTKVHPGKVTLSISPTSAKEKIPAGTEAYLVDALGETIQSIKLNAKFRGSVSIKESGDFVIQIGNRKFPIEVTQGATHRRLHFNYEE